MTGRREEILDAALAIADEHGLDAVSMRAVAERVGVTPMALYRHVKDKSALLDAVVGRLLNPVRPSTELPWRERLEALAHNSRALTQRHPWAAHLLFSRPAITADATRTVDLIYLGLLEAGVPEKEVPRLERLVTTFVLGFAASESSGRFGGGTDPRAERGRLPEGDLPGHGRLAPWLSRPIDLDAEFTADLADLLTLIENAAKPARKPDGL